MVMVKLWAAGWKKLHLKASHSSGCIFKKKIEIKENDAKFTISSLHHREDEEDAEQDMAGVKGSYWVASHHLASVSPQWWKLKLSVHGPVPVTPPQALSPEPSEP